MIIPFPCLVFVGDVTEPKQAKTAKGLVEWRPERCVGQYRMNAHAVDLGIPNMTLHEAVALGAKTFLIGISPYEPHLPEHYRPIVMDAIRLGMNIASGLHARLVDDTEIRLLAEEYGVGIFDFRHRPLEFPKGSGKKRSGLRLLTVGNDCACGKKYTALSIHRSLQNDGIKSSFRSTGQTGFLISDGGINNDTIPADFLSGAAEWLSPTNDPDHWDIIEGQGSIWHPSFAGGSLSLLLGSQPDVLVLCHEPGRASQRGVEAPPMSLDAEILVNLTMGQRTNPNIRLGAISVFGANMDREELFAYMDKLSAEFCVPVFDPSLGGPAYEQFIYQLQCDAYEAGSATGMT